MKKFWDADKLVVNRQVPDVDSVTVPCPLSDNEDSVSPPLSAERDFIMGDLRMTLGAIQDSTDEQLWAEVQAIPDSRLEAVATYPNFRFGLTPLHLAAEFGNAAMVRLLLQHGASLYVDEFDQDPNDESPNHTPLTSAVAHYCETSNVAVIEKLLEHSEHRADALWTAILCYEQEEDASKRVECKEILDWLLTRPEIIGNQKDIRGCLNIPNQLTGIRALQLICHYRDLEYFFKLLPLLPEPAPGEEPEYLQLDNEGNTILHLAVSAAHPYTREDIEFIGHLLTQFPSLRDMLNYSKKTALSLSPELEYIFSIPYTPR